MLIAAFLLLIFANIVNHSKGISQNVKIAFLVLIYIWFILIFSSRGTSVPDTVGYIKYYYANGKNDVLEYLFTWMCRTANSIGLSFNGFLFIFQIILFSIWFYTTRKYFTDIHFVFLVFIPFMGIYNFGIIIRAAMGLCLCYYAIMYLLHNKSLKGYLIYYGIVTIAVFFQQSMIAFYILPLYVFKNYNSLVLGLVLVISIFIPLVDIQHLIANVIEFYVKFFSSNKFLSYTRIHAKFNIHGIYSMTMIKYWIMAVIFIFLRTNIVTRIDVYNCFLNLYITGVLLITLTYFISAGNRLAYMFFFFEFALVGILYENSNIPRKIVFLGAIALCLLNYVNLVSAVPSMLTY